MRFNEKQRAAWMALGEAILNVYARVSDLSLPNEVALDHAWLLESVRSLKTLADRWGRTLPGIQRNSLNAERRMARARTLMNALPMLVAEASDGAVEITHMTPPAHLMMDGVRPPRSEEPN